MPDSVIVNLKNRPKTALPMDVLQSCIPSLADFDENIYSDTKEDNITRAISLISKIPAIVAAWNRIRMGLDV
ncbi:MAG TPA: citrate/2-methylcitrate synthase, partial [Nitrososphaeraceae archaeon]|nr:citrate/2-methylcitrate synthase [Nitrososphaeraceae archaeon]